MGLLGILKPSDEEFMEGYQLQGKSSGSIASAQEHNMVQPGFGYSPVVGTPLRGTV